MAIAWIAVSGAIAAAAVALWTKVGGIWLMLVALAARGVACFGYFYLRGVLTRYIVDDERIVVSEAVEGLESIGSRQS